MARTKYRICPFGCRPQSRNYGYAFPKLCPCGATLQVATQHQYFTALIAYEYAPDGSRHTPQEEAMNQTTKRCNRCNALLTAIEAQSDTCNRCLDLGYATMTDAEYDVRFGAAVLLAGIADTHDHLQGRTNSSAAGYLAKARRVAEDAQDQTDLDLSYGYLQCARKALGMAVTALALCLSLATPAAAQTPTFDQPVPTWQRPASDAFVSGCIVEETHDDGSMLAYCPEDGSYVAFDPDGNRWVNESGAPLKLQGKWYAVQETP